LLRLVARAHAATELAEAVVTLCDERAHPEFFGERAFDAPCYHPVVQSNGLTSSRPTKAQWCRGRLRRILL